MTRLSQTGRAFPSIKIKSLVPACLSRACVNQSWQHGSTGCVAIIRSYSWGVMTLRWQRRKNGKAALLQVGSVHATWHAVASSGSPEQGLVFNSVGTGFSLQPAINYLFWLSPCRRMEADPFCGLYYYLGRKITHPRRTDNPGRKGEQAWKSSLPYSFFC